MFINSIWETKYDLFAYIIVVTLVMIFLLPALIYLIILFIVNISSCQSYSDICPFFWQYDLWVSVTLIVNGVSPYISHITKYTGLRQFEKRYNVISPMFLFNCPNFDIWYLHFYKNGHVSL